jgi:hypothetical protein
MNSPERSEGSPPQILLRGFLADFAARNDKGMGIEP